MTAVRKRGMDARPPRSGFASNVSSFWGTSRQPVRCHRAPRHNITHGAQAVSVNVFPPKKRFVSGGGRTKNRQNAQSCTFFAGTPDAIG